MQKLLKKGSEANRRNYRDIVPVDDCGKSVSKHIRKNTLPLVGELTSNTQYGSGLNGGKTAVAHLHARLFLESNKACRSTSGLFFLMFPKLLRL